MSSFSWSPVQSGSSGGVTTLNTLEGALTLAAGSGITITPSGGNTLTIAASGGSGANTTLSNLGTTEINASLIPALDDTINLGTAAKSFESGFINSIIATGYYELIKSVTHAWWGGPGPGLVIDPDALSTDTLLIGSKDSATGNNGYHAVMLRTGQVTGASAAAGSGELYIGTGDVSGSSRASGYLEIRTGNTSNTGSGDIFILTGSAGGGFNRGIITLDAFYIDLNFKQIKNLATPTAGGDATNKTYVDLFRAPQSASAPGTPVGGQVYFDTNVSKLKVYNGAAWETITSSV